MYYKKELNRIFKLLFIVFCILLISLSLTKKANRYGDGWEYLGMTISFSNHHSFDLRNIDILERQNIARENNLDLPQDLEYSGYFQDLNGRYYSYHFWFYSLICWIPYLILKLSHINPLKVFYFTNVLLILLLFWWIIFRSQVTKRSKLWLLFTLVVNPIWLYVPWSHPEVFSFVFLYIGLLEFKDNHKSLACLFTSIASFQNPAIAIVTATIFIIEIIRFKKINSSNIIQCLTSLSVFIPFLFYWFHFHKFSLISSSGYASFNYISFSKVLNLFVDPNFGLVTFIPVLIFVLLWLVVRLDKVAIMWTFVLIFIAIVDSTQLHWNSGMMYINRYAVWLIPIVIITTLDFFINITKKQLIIYSTLFSVTTGILTGYYMKEYDTSNYLKFSPFAQAIISIAPSLYNPPYDVFAERTLGKEVTYTDKLPLIVSNSKGPRKELVMDQKTGLIDYLNGPLSISNDILIDSNQFSLKNINAGEDIFTQNENVSFGRGWYDLEGDHTRWANDDSLLYINLQSKSVYWNMQFSILSFYKSRDCIVYLNNKKVYNGLIGSDLQTINFSTQFNNGINSIRIVSSSRGQAPKDIHQLNNLDSRKLAFRISGVSISKSK